jgi:hypothetical protein
MEKEAMKYLTFVLTLSALLLSACGSKAAPTVDPVQVQASALAAAGTMIAETQAAIPPTAAPTDTPQPTPTDLASPTPLTLPTLAAFPTAAAAPTASGAGSSCSGPISNKPSGPLSPNVRIVNSTKSLVTISLYLDKNKFGECGYKSYVIAAGQSINLNYVLPFGCYTSYAFSQDPRKPFHVSSGPDCITGPDKTTFNIQQTILKVTGP